MIKILKIFTSYTISLFKLILSYILHFVEIFFFAKKRNYWIFPVYFIGEGDFTDNSFAIFEQVRMDCNIKKIILTRSKEIHLEGDNIEIVPISSIKAIYYLLVSRVIFVQHSLWLDLKNSWFQIIYPRDRIIVNLWHGIPIKDISHENAGVVNKRSLKEMPNYRVITSSSIDMSNMKKAFAKTPDDNFWITGLPRNDFLLMDDCFLPANLRIQSELLKELLNGRKLILYAPTYRETQNNGTYYSFTDIELSKLDDFLTKNNYCLGIRYHIYRKPDINKLLQYDNVIDLSSDHFSDVRVILRNTDVLVTDYSSLYIDAIYIDVKCVNFAYDFEHYMLQQRGFFYDYSEVFPGGVNKCLSDVLLAIDNINDESYSTQNNNLKSIFFKDIDSKNSARVINMLKQELELY